ncbi:two-component system sensor histidine kinase YesM [Bacillus niacini]|uniref:histidine kinase n=1 Tax=Neobacillus niacini TaxID=86668 RepID=A0A852T9E0_9BACI|nr:histidine kinase [Neobacillus niacini]NYE04407.1 two-component system sensor histidine kinase YesM [Neobacillus niacini]
MGMMKQIFNSLMFKLFLAIFLIIGPLIIVHIINNYYANEVIRNQVAQSNKNMLNIYMDQIDKSLEGVGNYIFQLSANTDLYFLQYHENFDLNDYEEAKIRLFNSINNQSYFYTAIDSIFLYSSSYKDFFNTKKNDVNFSERMNATEEIHALLENKSENLIEGKWNLWKGKKNYYLLYYLNIDGVYVGAWVNMNNLIKPFKYIDFGETGRAMLATSELHPITNKDFIEDEKIDLTVKGNKFAIVGEKERFVAMKERSTVGDFYFLALIPESEILDKLPFLQRISSIISIGAVLFLFLFIFIMRKVFLQPINQIVSAMKKLRQGNMEIRVPMKRNSTEFEVMNGTFNHMISEIRDLKINVYEEKLNLQRAELKHLQLQINPHFFLNSLNIIYNLATVKEFTIIQEMSKCLANYFRFMFSSNSYFVSLEDELKHTENYLKIQQLRFPDSINFNIESPSELIKCNIPPLVIQTIAENSIKHAFHMDEPINIHITVKKDCEDSSFMEIIIQDTGEGFPEEVLRSLEIDDPLTTQKGERIGLWNVKRRLNLLYDGITSIHFSNEHGKGATVRIRLPI